MSLTAAPELARLLEHPAIWRGRSAARAAVWPTGYAALDACLPGGGWPRSGLIEILLPRFGVGESYVLLPALAAASGLAAARWCVWVAPPLEPYAPALAAHGMSLERMLVVRAPEPLWALEQALASGACDAVLAWAARDPLPREIRRLQLAAERGRTLAVLFRPRRAARLSSPAILRLVIEPCAAGVRLDLLKSRGGSRGAIELAWPVSVTTPPAAAGASRGS